MNDIFREKAGEQQADNKLDGEAERVVFTSACLRSVLDLLGLSWPKDYYLAIGTERTTVKREIEEPSEFKVFAAHIPPDCRHVDFVTMKNLIGREHSINSQ